LTTGDWFRLLVSVATLNWLRLQACDCVTFFDKMPPGCGLYELPGRRAASARARGRAVLPSGQEVFNLRTALLRRFGTSRFPAINSQWLPLPCQSFGRISLPYGLPLPLSGQRGRLLTRSPAKRNFITFGSTTDSEPIANLRDIADLGDGLILNFRRASRLPRPMPNALAVDCSSK